MDKQSSSLLAITLLLCAAQASAASTAQLAVQGSITPSACQPTLSAGGNVDHGKLSAKDLKPEDYTSLEQATMAFTMSCEGPTLLALKTIDNRSGSAIFPDWHAHGLGTTAEGENLGSVSFSLNDTIADSVAVTNIISTDEGETWTPAGPLGHSVLTSFAANGGPYQPIPVQTVNASLAVYTTLNKAADLTLTDEIPMDGHATLEVIYL